MALSLYYSKHDPMPWKPLHSRSEIFGIGVEKEFLVLENGRPVQKKKREEMQRELKKLISGFPSPQRAPDKWNNQELERVDIETLEQGIGAGYLITEEFVGSVEDHALGLEVRTLPCATAGEASTQLALLEKILYETFASSDFTVAPIAASSQEGSQQVFALPSIHLHFSPQKDVLEAASSYGVLATKSGQRIEADTPEKAQIIGTIMFSTFMEYSRIIATAFAANSTDNLRKPNLYDLKAATIADDIVGCLQGGDSTLGIGRCIWKYNRGTIEMRGLDSMVSSKDTLVPIALAAAYNRMLAHSFAPRMNAGEGSGMEQESDAIYFLPGSLACLIALENSRRISRDGIGAKLLFVRNPKDLDFYSENAFGSLELLAQIDGALGRVGLERGWFVERTVGEHLRSIRNDLLPHLNALGASEHAIETIFSADKCQSYKHETIGDEVELAHRAADDSVAGRSWYNTKID